MVKVKKYIKRIGIAALCLLAVAFVGAAGFMINEGNNEARAAVEVEGQISQAAAKAGYTVQYVTLVDNNSATLEMKPGIRSNDLHGRRFDGFMTYAEKSGATWELGCILSGKFYELDGSSPEEKVVTDYWTKFEGCPPLGRDIEDLERVLGLDDLSPKRL